jgi:hypothetical protein
MVLFGLGSSSKLQSNNVPCTFNTNSFDFCTVNGDFGGPILSSELT